MAGLNARGLQSKLLITWFYHLVSEANYYTAGMVQPKITTCTLGLATVVITLGNLASFPSYSCLVYMIAVLLLISFLINYIIIYMH